MKLRADFVTNSSSSSFVVMKSIDLSEEKSETEPKLASLVSFVLEKTENRTTNEDSPDDFSDFAGNEYFDTGIKPTVAKIISNRKTLSRYLSFLNQKYKTDLSMDDIIFSEESHNEEYGETFGDDLERFTASHLAFFHPEIQNIISNHESGLLGLFGLELFSQIVLYHCHEVQGKKQKHYIAFHMKGWENTVGFYQFLYEKCKDSLHLEISDMKDILKKIGMSEKAIQWLISHKMRILYAENKSKDNDVVVYSDSETEKICVLPYDDFLSQVVFR